MKIQLFMALVVLSLATVPGARAAVLAGPITNAANGHTYYLLSTNTWTASEAEARGLGGHLVTINDAAENQWVQNTFFAWTGDAALWIGLNDAANEGQFVWASGEPVTFTYWYPGEPNDLGGEDYAAIRRPFEVPPTGSWNDTSGLVHPTSPIFGVVELPPDPTPLPAAATQLADQFMPDSARLNGLANPSGSPTLAWFEWGTSLAYGNVTTPQSVGSGSNLVGFSNVLVGLVIGTEYHFRARASNAFGFAAGVNQTFNLNNQRPVVATLAADQLSSTSARLRGQVNPRGWPTAAWFEWGTDTNYGNVIGMQDVGQGSSVSNLNVVLNGLMSGLNYHYRLAATNAFGAAYGANQMFTTTPTTITWTGADPSGHWSAPANWSPAGVPVNGDALVFPGGLPPGDMVSTNDLTGSFFRSIRFNQGSRHTIRGNPMTLTNRTDCIINSGTNVIACDLTFSGTPATPTFGVISMRGQVGPSGVVSELTVIGNVGGGSLYANLERLVIRGQFTGGTLRLWGGTLAFYGDDPSAGSAEVQNSATLLVQGSRPNLNSTMFWEFESAACPFLRGDGVVGDVMGCGHIILDSTLSVKSLGGRGASQYGWRVLDIRLNGTNVGEYGRLISSGDVTLTGGSLSASPSFNPQPGQVFTIVNKTSPGPITTVPGYDPTLFGPEGKIITLNGMPFRLSYVGGDGNDVTLTVETNARPTVTITNPPNAAVFTAPASFSLAASASDPDGSVTNVQFFRDATSLGNDSSSPYSASVNGLAAGNYILSAVASDNHGLRATNSIVVTVAAPPPATNTWTGADPSGYWSAPANWSPAGVPVNGNDLVFPGGLPPGDKVSTNDLADRIFRSIRFQAGGYTIRGNPMTLTNRSDCIINGGTNVIACDLTFTGTPSTPNYLFPSIRDFTGPFGELTVIGHVGGSSLYVFSMRLVIRGQFTGGSLRQQYGSLALFGDNPHAVSVEILGASASTLRIQGSQPNLNIAMLWEMESASCPTLSGDGVVGDVTGCGYITPDSTLSVKNLGGQGASQYGWRVLNIHLNGTNVGEYSRLVAPGNVSLGSGNLLPSAGFSPQAGQVFTIVEKTSPGSITNAIFGPEGTVTTLNGMPFRLSYVGGDGNDVTLTATDAPPTVTITNPPNGAVFEPPASFTLGAAAADPGGSVTNVQFFLDATSLGNDTSSPYSVPVSGLVVGNYTLTVVASDDAGTHATNSIAITVQTRPDWDVSRDFSLTANPGGPWSYGYMNVLGGAFSLLTHSQYGPDNNGLMIFLWSKNGYEPVAVFKNPTSQTSISDGGYGTFPPGTVWFSAGVEGNVDNYGVIRFTVPADKAGTYRVETAVRTYLDGLASHDADFWVLRNGTQVFSRFLGPNSGTGYTNIFTLAAGDTIDFVCGRGQDNMIHGSGLKIRATLTRTPVPIVLGAAQHFGTQFVFSYSADVGLRYAVERAVQPGVTWSNWTTIWSNTANANPMTVTDTAATNGMNFYRVRRLPNP